MWTRLWAQSQCKIQARLLVCLKSNEECAEEDELTNSGSVSANNTIVEEEDTVEDNKDDDLDDDPDKADTRRRSGSSLN